MDVYFSLATFLFGAIIGSFLNALLFRFNTGRSVASGRSRCMHCNHELKALDLIPVFSFIYLRGRCRYCGTKISWQYPTVELAAAILSLSIYIQSPNVVFYGFWFFVWMILLCIVVYDIRHGIIPWSFSIILAVCAFIQLFFSPATLSVGIPTIESLLAGPALALPFFFFSLVSRGRWMGWGDSGLELSLGWLLGPTLGLTALMLGVWSGAIVGIILATISKRYTIKSEIPFAPFLALGAGLVFFFHVDFFSLIPILWQ